MRANLILRRLITILIAANAVLGREKTLSAKAPQGKVMVILKKYFISFLIYFLSLK